MKNNSEKRILLIGGGTGIGREIALLMGQKHPLTVLYNNSVGDIESLRELLQSSPHEHAFFQADLSTDAGLGIAIDYVVEHARQLFAIVYCSGAHEKKDYGSVTSQEFDHIYAVNAKAPFFLVQRLLPLLKGFAGDPPRLIMIGSTYAYTGGGRTSMLYSSSKSALINLSRTWARVLAPDVLSNAIIPGYIETKMFFRGRSQEEIETKRGAVPLGRLGKPEEVAGMVEFLLSEKANYVTGQAFHIDGGLFPS